MRLAEVQSAERREPRGDIVAEKRPSAHFYWAAVLICAFALIVFFWNFLTSGFNLIAGDVGDNRFLIVLLEHWRAVFHGQASFQSPNFFWPEPDILGYSDGMFLFSLPYMIARGVGADSYLAFELTLILLKIVGFVSMLWLLRSFVRVSRTVALVGAVLFTISNMYVVLLNHAQLQCIVFVPLIACLAFSAWIAYGEERKAAARIYAVAFGVLLALVLFTSFYTGWFTIFFASIAVPVAVLKVAREQGFSTLARCYRVAATRTEILFFGAGGFCIAIIPFLFTYVPALELHIGPSLQDVLAFSSHPASIFDTGGGNWMWGRLVAKLTSGLDNSPAHVNIRVGWPPGLFVLTGIGGVLGMCRTRLGKYPSEGAKYSNFLSAVLSITFFVGLAVSLNLGGHSLWYFVFKFVPGGSAIHIPSRLNLVLNVLAIVVACLLLTRVERSQMQFRRIAFYALIVLLLGEQINTAQTHTINRTAENSVLRRFQRPPAACQSFFFARPLASPRPFSAGSQIDAMLVARRFGIPTLNGYSSLWPSGWDFFNFNDSYFKSVRRWAMDKHVASGLCELDLQNGLWARADLRALATAFPGDLDDMHSAHRYSPSQRWILNDVEAILLREPTDAQLAKWSGLPDRNSTESEFVAELFNSPEFQETTVPRLWAYLDRSRRWPRFNEWTSARALPPNASFFESETEQTTYDRNAAVTCLLYFALLGRDPDPAGFVGWSNALAKGATIQSVAANFLNSPEYKSRYVR